jgi:GNAT superfamily N-acetyltransferase
MLRAARPTDAGTTGMILWQFLAETDWLPCLYSAAETIAFCCDMIDRGWVTVAERDGQVLGFIARDGQEVCGLYLAPEARGQGLGRMLLDASKRRVDRLHLRSFAADARAQRFYAKAGFRAVATGDGADNDENLPDIHYVWRKEAAA